jgi:hypothetical protein
MPSFGNCTHTNVNLRTSGNTINRVGKAINHDRPQEPSHNGKNAGIGPTLRKVLTIEITQVMMMERKSGSTTVEYRVGNKGKPQGPVRGAFAGEWSVFIP